ncbi:hypothetical protein [Lapidilactobacillus gannanensis]|uniref:Uncharacterized protein n=1 Tax=Lapidilactobacillus gannanensis TaxID=2486002 RepID=A0ABW4BR64_9LACO|nr:hypothetical protein [Lapidilactobacillus gannanensis]
MNTVIEMTDQFGLDYYYVTVTFTADALVLQNPASNLRQLNCRLPMDELVEEPVSPQFWTTKYSLSYDKILYTFVDYGTGVIPYLKQYLRQHTQQLGHN